MSAIVARYLKSAGTLEARVFLDNIVDHLTTAIKVPVARSGNLSPYVGEDI